MISEGRIPMTDEEAEVLEGISDVVSLTRRDPGETVPLVVHTAEQTFVVAPDMSGDMSVTEV